MRVAQEADLRAAPSGFGLHWEADAVARSLRDGEKENPHMPHVETLLEMKVRLRDGEA